MKLFIKAAAVLLAATLLLAGCAGGNTAWAYESGDTQMPTGLYIIYEINAIADAGSKILEANKDNADFQSPKPSELLKMTVDGQPALDYINENTIKSVRNYFAVMRQFDSMGLSLSDSETAAAQNTAKSVMEQAKDLYEKNGISENSVKEYYLDQLRRDKLFTAFYGAGGELAPPEDEVMAYFRENYFMTEAMPLYKTSTTANDTKTTDTKTLAEGYLTDLQNGKGMEEIAYEWQLEIAGGDNTSVEKPSHEEMIMTVTDADRETYGDVLIDAIKNAEPGVPQLVEDEYFYALIKRVDVMSDPTRLETYRSDILAKLKEKEFEQQIADWGASVEMEANTATTSRYKPANLKLDDAIA